MSLSVTSIVVFNYHSYRETYGFRKEWSIMVKIVVLLTCFALLSIAVVQVLYNNRHVSENEPRIPFTLQDIREDQKYGPLFPTYILNGFELENEIGLYNNTVVQANFYNDSINEELIIKIAPKDFFGDVQLNVVLYKDTLDEKGSLFYVDAKDYIVCYSFSKSDIALFYDFHEMVSSARFYDN